ncbi:hypothetical protein I2I05_11665 [Hymenobacter sp. BT683]|uniref:Ankyrin repeat domain-containing protein n=1 Tax=Hymenobacter jeongseonensis TaxID=2791027 RepID=A0ABS0II58_9BACT|nr:hypothetical protein [Hymenobacter jeongseonensis]MBF9238052.1 hypothetical protein [Hymenobacter jeongseonensis]
MPPLPASPNRWFRWADRLLYAGLGLAVLTIVPEAGLLTLFVVPCCLYLSWVAYVAGWPARRLSGGEWARVALSALLAHLVVGWMLHGGYLKSALVCGGELLLALAWQRHRPGAGRGLPAGAVLGLWLAVAWLGLRSGDLFAAVRTQDSRWTQLLLLTGSDANERQPTSFRRGQPVLYEALFTADPDAEIVALLLRHGADPNGVWRRDDGSVIQPVAIALAGYQRTQLRTPVLRLLLQAGLNPCLPDQHGQTLRAALTAFGPTVIADSAALARAEERFGCR